LGALNILGWLERELEELCHWHGHQFHVILRVGRKFVVLNPRRITHMATSLQVGQSLPLSIMFSDQNGSPMNVTPVPDSPPTWTNTTAATGGITPSADGLSASYAGVAAGTDTINLSVVVGGKTFAASIAVTVAAAAQVLTSVEIVAGTPA
jgi:hypothetical protein